MNTSGTDVRYTIGADTSPYKRAMDRIKNETNVSTDKIKAAWKALGAAGVVAVGAITAAVVSGTKSMAEFERLQLRTAALIKATGNAAGFTANELTNFASALDLQTLADRDNIMGAINALQTFKSVHGAVFTRAIELSQDLSEVLGTDMRSQVVMLGKALEDPVRGLSSLRRVGVTFTEAEEDQIKALAKANKMFEAQSKILDTLSGQVGGAGKAAAGGLAGQIDTLSFRWRELTEAMSNTSAAVAGISALNKTLETMTNLLQPSKLNTAMQFFKQGYWNTAEYKAFINAGPGERQAMIDAEMGSRLSPHEQWRLGNTQGSSSAAPVDPGTAAKTYTDAELSAFAKGADDYVDLWQLAAQDRYEVMSRHYEDMIALEDETNQRANELSQARAEEYTDFWLLKSKERYDIVSRYMEMEYQDFQNLEKSKREAFSATLSIIQSLGTLAMQTGDQQNKKQFERQKKLSIGMAVISTAAGAANALRDYKYPYSLFVMAAVLASGLVQINRIQSQQYGSNNTSLSAPGGSAGGDTSISSDPAYSNGGEKSTLNITIEGDFIGDEAYIDMLVERINDASDRDVYVNQSKYAGSLA